jgi:hypothetical protein
MDIDLWRSTRLSTGNSLPGECQDGTTETCSHITWRYVTHVCKTVFLNYQRRNQSVIGKNRHSAYFLCIQYFPFPCVTQGNKNTWLQIHIHAPNGIRTCYPSVRAIQDRKKRRPSTVYYELQSIMTKPAGSCELHSLCSAQIKLHLWSHLCFTCILQAAGCLSFKTVNCVSS